MKKPLIIEIIGPAMSGKTTLSRLIVNVPNINDPEDPTWA
jgi:uridine kinase